VPDVLLRICAKTSFFDLSENNFDFTHEEEGGYTYLRDVVEHVHNFSDHKRLDLVNRSEYTGQFALLVVNIDAKYAGANSCAVMQTCRDCSITRTSPISFFLDAGKKA
jgi:hypothetical protein